MKDLSDMPLLWSNAPMTHIRAIQLHQFRNYERAALEGLGAGAVVLYGANGAGKTNILEALSLLSPGRGLRGVKIAEMQRAGAQDDGWAVSAQADTQYGLVQIGTGRDPASDKRTVRINGAPAKGQSALAEYLSCIWLTPQMDRIFIDGASARRRFLDRLVFAFDPGHSGRTTRFENALAQRSKILREMMTPDPAWLDALEATIAETGVAIAAARLECVAQLQNMCDRAGVAEDRLFPRAHLSMRGTIEELLGQAPALEVEDLYKYQLRRSRGQDAQTGGAATGPHKSDLRVSYAAKGMAAEHCSTGEQKALLIGIVLAHGRLVAGMRGAPPLLLLDEIAAHLDDARRAGLYDLLAQMGGQVWMTGTDVDLFRHIDGTGQFFHVENGLIAPRRCHAA